MPNKEEIEEAYWKGYIQKQNEAMEICKQCKYIKKARKLEKREQRLRERLEEVRNKLAKNDFVGYADEITEIIENIEGE